MKQLAVLFLFILACSVSEAQRVTTVSEPEGFWNGSMIRSGNSVQHFTVEFTDDGDSLMASFAIPDWVYYSPLTSRVLTDGKKVTFDSYYGELQLLLDSSYAEMVGECNFALVHMKKGLRPPKRRLELMEEDVSLGDINTQMRITKPAGNGRFTTVILVHGRGCGSKDIWDNRAAVLAQYGLAVVEYDKRGSASTGFDCEKTSMDMHASDLAKLTDHIRTYPFVEKLGYLGYSAGGWTSPKASSMSQKPADFIISVVGPATSVLQQQIDCSRYYVGEELGLNDEALAQAIEYAKLEAEGKADKKTFKRMTQLLTEAEANGWISVLELDDIPKSSDDISNLWVQRNRYDPSSDLSQFRGPFLSILGGDDFVVPFRENRDRFVQLFEGVGKKNYQISIIPSAGHGMEHGHISRDLGYDADWRKWYTYWKYDRVAAGAIDEMIRFMRQYDLIE